jgi:hypothetical protein
MRAIHAADAMDKATAVEALARDSKFDGLSEPVEELRQATDSVYLAIQHFRAR